MDRKSVLASAMLCVTGKREVDHGKPEDSFGAIADLWNAYLGRRFPEAERHINSIDVSVMLMLLKVGRIASGQGCADNFIDIAGYAACAGEIYDKASRLSGEDENDYDVE